MFDPRLFVAPVAPGRADRGALVERAHRRGLRRFALPVDDPVPSLEGVILIRRSPHELTGIDPGQPTSSPVAVELVRDSRGLDELVARSKGRSLIAVRWEGDRVIPLENLLSALAGSTRVWVVTDQVEQVPAALGALERGADGVVVEIDTPGALERLEGLLVRSLPPSLDWQSVTVRRVEPVGVGDRVIVDTTSLLAPSDGLLVGSSAGFLFHVASEALGSSFSGPRPFRVNAGSAHSYVLTPDGSTRYLAELQPGDGVLVGEARGKLRSVRVGRLKIERRPLVLVEVEHGGRRVTVFLQEAETVRLSGERGRVATSSIRPGEVVLGVALPPARHLGKVVQEMIDER
ncbi:MAG: 3-dehydroquinate synthase II [Candidatus Lutacidiplasmatales archaeon]